MLVVFAMTTAVVQFAAALTAGAAIIAACTESADRDQDRVPLHSHFPADMPRHEGLPSNGRLSEDSRPTTQWLLKLPKKNLRAQREEQRRGFSCNYVVTVLKGSVSGTPQRSCQ